MKHITVFGASGKVGRLVVERLLRNEYAVTAFVHGSHTFSASDTLHVVTGDVHELHDVRRALKNTDAVVSTLGSWGTSTQDVLRSAMGNIVPEMERTGIRRIVSLTGSEARARGDDLSAIHRVAHRGMSLIAGKVLSDGEAHLSVLEKSSLDWTVVRSPAMTTIGKQGFTLNDKRPLPWQTIHRFAVADAMVAQLEDDRFVQSAPYIHR